jgi:hypothetical protein
MTSFSTTLLVFVAAGSIWLGSARGARAEPIVVVVGKGSPVRQLSVGDLQRIFLQLPVQTSGNVPFIPFNHPPRSSVRERFDNVVLGMSPEEVARYWIDQKIRGQPAAPRTIHSPSLLCQLVARLPGAITYVPASLVGPQCKAVVIGGRAPGHPDYVLASDSPAQHLTLLLLTVRQMIAEDRAILRPRGRRTPYKLGQLAEPSSCRRRACSRQSVVFASAISQQVQPTLQSAPPGLHPCTRHCPSSMDSQ